MMPLLEFTTALVIQRTQTLAKRDTKVLKLNWIMPFLHPFQLNLALSHSRHKYVQFVDRSNDYSGNEIERAPRNKIGAALHWSPTAVFTSTFNFKWITSVPTGKIRPILKKHLATHCFI